MSEKETKDKSSSSVDQVLRIEENPDKNNPFLKLFSRNIDLCLESGAKDTAFCEMDSLIGYILSQKCIISCEHGIPFLHFMFLFEKFLKMVVVERNIRIQFIYFSQFELIWSHPGMKLLRLLVLNHIETKLSGYIKGVNKFESPQSEEYRKYLNDVHPFLLICSNENSMNIPFVNNENIYGWNFLHNFVNISCFSKSVHHVVPYSSLRFQSSSISGFMYSSNMKKIIKILPELERPKKEEVEGEEEEEEEEEKKKKKEDEMQVNPTLLLIKDSLSLLLEEEKKNGGQFEMYASILFEAAKMQRILSIKERSIEIPGLPISEQEALFLNRFFENCVRLLLLESSTRFDIKSIDVDFIDTRLFIALVKKKEENQYDPIPFEMQKYSLNQSNEMSLKYDDDPYSPIQQLQQQQEEEIKKEEKKIKSPDGDSDSDDDDDWDLSEEEGEEEEEEEEEEELEGEGEEVNSKENNLWKINHDVIEVIDSFPGKRILTDEEKKNKQEEQKKFKDIYHWKISIPLAKPNKKIQDRWGQSEVRLIDSYIENIDREKTIDFRRSLPSLSLLKNEEKNGEEDKRANKKKQRKILKSLQKTADRNKIDSLKKKIEKFKEYCEKKTKNLKLLTKLILEEDIDVTEELIFWYYLDLKQLQSEIKFIDDNKKKKKEKKWKFFHNMVMIKTLLKVKKKIIEINNNNKKNDSKKNKEIIQLQQLLKKMIPRYQNQELPSDEVYKEFNVKDYFFGSSQIEFQMENREKYESIEEFKSLTTLNDYLDHKNFIKFKKTLGFVPDPWQLRLMDCIDKNKRSLVVTPTSSGKTFLSLYAMGRVLEEEEEEGKKTNLVFVAPTNSLVNQVATDVLKHFLGDRTNNRFSKNKNLLGVFTSDEKIGPVDCRILVTNPECLHILLLSNDEKHMKWKNSLKFIVFDEIHTINDIGKGDVLERLILMSPCPFIALSADIGNHEELKEWMSNIKVQMEGKGRNCDVELILNKNRPNDLKYHVFDSEKRDMKVIHPVGLLNDFIEDIKALKKDIRVLKRLTPSQCLELYSYMKSILNNKDGFLDSVNPNTFFGDCEWELIPRVMSHNDNNQKKEKEEEESEGEENEQKKKKSLHDFEDAIREKLCELLDIKDSGIPNFRKIVLKCREDLFDRMEVNEKQMDEEKPHRVMRTTLVKMVTMMDKKNLFPSLMFHLSRAGVVKLGQFLANLILVKSQLEEDDDDDDEKEKKEEDEEEDESEKERKEMVKIAMKEALGRLDMENSKAKELLNELMKCDFVKSQCSSEIKNEIRSIKENKLNQFRNRTKKFQKKKKLEDGDLEEDEDEDPILLCLRYSIGIHHGALDKYTKAGVERLFRKGLLKILICTGTLSYGINAPCKSVVLLGDSPYLTPTLFNQMTGRSGRRGFDTLGNILIFGIPRERLRRLIVHDNEKIIGHSIITPSYVMRLMVSMQKKAQRKNILPLVKQLMSLPLTCIHNLKDKKYIEREKDTMTHHFRFSLEFCREISLLNRDGEGVFLAGLASHLFHTEPSNFLLIHFLRSLVFDKLRKNKIEGIKDEKEQKKIVKAFVFNVLCHLFTDVEIKPTENKKLILESLDDEVLKEVHMYGDTVKKIFKKYLKKLAKEKKKEKKEKEKKSKKRRVTHILPLSKTKVGCLFQNQDELLEKYNLINFDLIEHVLCNIFHGLSGIGDEVMFEELEIPDVLQCLDIFFDSNLFPLPISMLEGKNKRRHISSFVYRFLNEKDKKMKHLAEEHGFIPQIIDWNLGGFRRKLQTIKTSLIQMAGGNQGGGVAGKDNWLLEAIKEITKDFNDRFFKNNKPKRFKFKWRPRRGNKGQRKREEEEGRKTYKKKQRIGNDDEKKQKKWKD